jgi:hypothetical protein
LESAWIYSVNDQSRFFDTIESVTGLGCDQVLDAITGNIVLSRSMQKPLLWAIRHYFQLPHPQFGKCEDLASLKELMVQLKHPE